MVCMVNIACLMIHGCSLMDTELEEASPTTPIVLYCIVPVNISVATEEPNEAACEDNMDNSSKFFYRWNDTDKTCMACVVSPEQRLSVRSYPSFLPSFFLLIDEAEITYQIAKQIQRELIRMRNRRIREQFGKEEERDTPKKEEEEAEEAQTYNGVREFGELQN